MANELKALVTKWRTQIIDYPLSLQAAPALAAVKLCADELEAALAASGAPTEQRCGHPDHPEGCSCHEGPVEEQRCSVSLSRCHREGNECTEHWEDLPNDEPGKFPEQPAASDGAKR